MSHSSGIKQGVFNDIQNKIIEYLSDEGLSSAKLVSKLIDDNDIWTREQIVKVISYLLSEEMIHQKDGVLYI